MRRRSRSILVSLALGALLVLVWSAPASADNCSTSTDSCSGLLGSLLPWLGAIICGMGSFAALWPRNDSAPDPADSEPTDPDGPTPGPAPSGGPDRVDPRPGDPGPTC